MASKSPGKMSSSAGPFGCGSSFVGPTTGCPKTYDGNMAAEQCNLPQNVPVCIGTNAGDVKGKEHARPERLISRSMPCNVDCKHETEKTNLTSRLHANYASYFTEARRRDMEYCNYNKYNTASESSVECVTDDIPITTEPHTYGIYRNSVEANTIPNGSESVCRNTNLQTLAMLTPTIQSDTDTSAEKLSDIVRTYSEHLHVNRYSDCHIKSEESTDLHTLPGNRTDNNFQSIHKTDVLQMPSQGLGIELKDDTQDKHYNYHRNTFASANRNTDTTKTECMVGHVKNIAEIDNSCTSEIYVTKPDLKPTMAATETDNDTNTSELQCECNQIKQNMYTNVVKDMSHQKIATVSKSDVRLLCPDLKSKPYMVEPNQTLETENEDSELQQTLKSPVMYSPKNKQYKCDICNVSFGFRSNLVRHKKTSKHIQNEMKLTYMSEMTVDSNKTTNYNTPVDSTNTFDELSKIDQFIENQTLKINKDNGESVDVLNKLVNTDSGVSILDSHGATKSGREITNTSAYLDIVESIGVEDSKSNVKSANLEIFEKNIEHLTQSINAISDSAGTVGAGSVQRDPETPEESRTCNACQKVFPAERFLITHLRRRHAVYVPLTCTVCGKTFTNKGDLRKHVRIHSKNNPYACELCDRSFKQKIHLKSHYRCHKVDREFSCTFCQATFKHKNNMTMHLRIHTGERPFACSKCDKTFTHNTNLKVHLRLHSGQKKYNCEICSREFTQKHHLLRHRSMHVNGINEMQFRCATCFKVYTQRHHYRRHLRRHVIEGAELTAAQLAVIAETKGSLDDSELIEDDEDHQGMEDNDTSERCVVETVRSDDATDVSASADGY